MGSLSRLLKMAKIHKVFGLDGKIIHESLDCAEKLLRANGVISVPTETVYGLACLAQRTTAVQRIYDIKRRSTMKPMAICVANVSDLDKWLHVTIDEHLLYQLLPGPITLIFERKDTLIQQLNPQLDKIGVRIPDQPFIRKLCERINEPLALTSANISNNQATLSSEEFQDLWPLLDGVFDAGCLGDIDPNRVGSTVIDLSVPGYFTIVRNGCAFERATQLMYQNGLKPIK